MIGGGDVVGFLLGIILAVALLALIWFLLGLFPLPEKVRIVVMIVIAVLALFYAHRRYDFF